MVNLQNIINECGQFEVCNQKSFRRHYNETPRRNLQKIKINTSRLLSKDQVERSPINSLFQRIYKMKKEYSIRVSVAREKLNNLKKLPLNSALSSNSKVSSSDLAVKEVKKIEKRSTLAPSDRQNILRLRNRTVSLFKQQSKLNSELVQSCSIPQDLELFKKGAQDLVRSLQKNQVLHEVCDIWKVGKADLIRVLTHTVNACSNSQNLGDLAEKMQTGLGYDRIVKMFGMQTFGVQNKKYLTLGITQTCEIEIRPNLGWLSREEEQSKLLKKLKKQVGESELRVLELKQSQAEMKSDIDQLRQQIETLSGQIYQMRSELAGKKEDLLKTEAELGTARQFLTNLEVKKKEIELYVQEQSNLHFRDASLRYKNAEGDLCEYASFLQYNKLAVDQDYVPQKMKIIQENLLQEMKTLNRTLIQSQSLSVEEKSVLMRDYVLKTHDKYRHILEEQALLIKAKTKFITTFIFHMSNWYDSWEGKEEIIGNLRAQFAFVCTKLAELGKHFSCGKCQSLRERSDALVFKLIDNYKLGNSFL